MLINLSIAQVDVNIFLLVCLGLVVGCISGLFGVGGGFILTPLLNVFFGIPYNVAVGSSLAQMVFTAFSGSMRHVRQGNVDYKLALAFFAGAVFGVRAGISILGSFSSEIKYCIRGHIVSQLDFSMSIIYLVFLISVGSYMLYETLRAKGPDCEVETGISREIRGISLAPRFCFSSLGKKPISIWPVLGLGLFIGCLSGLLGVGGGFILLPVLVYILGVPTKTAIGISIVQTFCTALFGALNHFMSGNVDTVLVMLILIGSVLGAQIGAWLTTRINCVSLRKYFGLLVLFSAFMIILKYL